MTTAKSLSWFVRLLMYECHLTFTVHQHPVYLPHLDQPEICLCVFVWQESQFCLFLFLSYLFVNAAHMAPILGSRCKSKLNQMLVINH